MSEITGCIVTYNSISTPIKNKQLETAITSVLNNTESLDFKLYIVDNHSQDGTADYVESTFPQVSVIRNSINAGFGAAHNLMLDKIDSKYHFVINPDIEIRNNVIGDMCAFMESHPEAGASSPKICFPDGRLQILARKNPKIKYLLASRLAKSREESKLVREYCMLDENIRGPVAVENSSGCFLCFRTEVFKKLIGFDERYFMYFEDYDILRRLNKIAKLYYLPDVVVYHEWVRDSSKNTKLLKIHIVSALKYFARWGLAG